MKTILVRTHLLAWTGLLSVAGCFASDAAGRRGEGGGATTAERPVRGGAEKAGKWELVPMPARSERTQAVHAALLPSGKVLLVNGSSARDNADPTKYAHVDNTALFDPTTGEWKRIASTPWPGEDRPDIDLFCTGHVHTYNGNVLFAGGTRTYEHNFQGHNASYEFDWRAETWLWAGRMGEGRWYASLIPRADGTIVAVGGISEVGDDQINNTFDVYNPFEADPAKRWRAYDARDPAGVAPRSPFSLDWGIDHYPRVFARLDGRLYLTNDGTGYGNRVTRRTYSFDLPVWKPGARVAWDAGPTRADRNRTYSPGLLDPTKEDGSILLLGGQQGSSDQTFGPSTPIAGAQVASSLERYDASTNAWTLAPKFLEEGDLKGRVNHFGVILPTKQILVVGGAAYHFFEPAFEPLLLTPDAAAPGGFRKQVMNPMTQPRLYHTTALLLPDGRVLVSGGNFKRAFLNADGSVDMGSGTSPDGRTADFEDKVFPAEIWQHEIYSPPYLFLPGARPEISSIPADLKYGRDYEIQVRNATPGASVVAIKLGSATHAFDMGQRLVSLPVVAQDVASGKATVRMPANGPKKNIYTPGFYMVFYVNEQGKPSKAAIVRFDGD